MDELPTWPDPQATDERAERAYRRLAAHVLAPRGFDDGDDELAPLPLALTA